MSGESRLVGVEDDAIPVIDGAERALFLVFVALGAAIKLYFFYYWVCAAPLESDGVDSSGFVFTDDDYLVMAIKLHNALA